MTFYGVDRLRFVSPLPTGATVRTDFESHRSEAARYPYRTSCSLPLAEFEVAVPAHH